jgi:hypothetical protein
MSRRRPAKAARRERRRRRPGRKSGITISLGATVGALATVITTSFFVYDRVTVRDDCGESPPAKVTAIEVDPQAKFLNWLDAVGIEPRANYTGAQLDTPGTLVRFRGEVWGMKNERVDVYLSLFEARSGKAKVRERFFYNQPLTECYDSIKKPLFQAAVPASGRVFVQVILKHGNDELGSGTSKEFRQAVVR